MADLDQLLKGAGEHAHKVLIELREPSLVPTYHLCVPPPGQDVIIACPWRGEWEKLASFTAVRKIAHESRATAVLFISEVWMRSVPRPLTSWHADRLDLTTPPSQSPDRKECVFAIATDRAKTKARVWQIVRDRPGESIIALVEVKEMDGTFEGRLLDGLLP